MPVCLSLCVCVCVCVCVCACVRACVRASERVCVFLQCYSRNPSLLHVKCNLQRERIAPKSAVYQDTHTCKSEKGIFVSRPLTQASSVCVCVCVCVCVWFLVLCVCAVFPWIQGVCLF